MRPCITFGIAFHDPSSVREWVPGSNSNHTCLERAMKSTRTVNVSGLRAAARKRKRSPPPLPFPARRGDPRRLSMLVADSGFWGGRGERSRGPFMPRTPEVAGCNLAYCRARFHLRLTRTRTRTRDSGLALLFWLRPKWLLLAPSRCVSPFAMAPSLAVYIHVCLCTIRLASYASIVVLFYFSKGNDAIALIIGGPETPPHSPGCQSVKDKRREETAP